MSGQYTHKSIDAVILNNQSLNQRRLDSSIQILESVDNDEDEDPNKISNILNDQQLHQQEQELLIQKKQNQKLNQKQQKNDKKQNNKDKLNKSVDISDLLEPLQQKNNRFRSESQNFEKNFDYNQKKTLTEQRLQEHIQVLEYLREQTKETPTLNTLLIDMYENDELELNEVESVLENEIEQSGQNKTLTVFKSVKSNNQARMTFSSQQFILYPMRFIITICFALAQATTSLLFATTGPVGVLLHAIYDESVFTVTLAQLSYLLMHPLFSYPASWIIEKYGIQKSVLLGGSLCVIGSFLRCLLNQYGFIMVIIGNIVAGIGRPFIVNAQSKVAIHWWGPEQRASVTAALSFVVTATIVLGNLIPGLMFGPYSKDKIGLYEDAIHHFPRGRELSYQLMGVEFIITAACILPNIIFLRNKPPTAPSLYAANMKKYDGDLHLQYKSILSNNSNFLILLIMYGLFFGSFKSLGVVLSFMMAPFGFQDTNQIAIIGVMPMASGFIGSALIPFIINKYNCHKLLIYISFIGSGAGLGLSYFVFYTEMYWVILIWALFLGFFVIPGVPVMLELAVELTYPIGESVSVGTLFAAGQVMGVGIGEVLSFIADPHNKYSTLYCCAIFLGCFIIGIILACFLKLNIKNMKKSEKQLEKSAAVMNLAQKLKGQVTIKQYHKNRSISEKLSYL